MTHIQKIEAVDTYRLRQKLLRPHQSMGQCRFDGDLDADTAHFGVYCLDELVGILSVYLAQNVAIPLPKSWQLRAMAIDEHVRGKGYGKMLTEAAESYVIENEGLCIWANARLHAVGFYEKLGYARVGQLFQIPDVGPHYLVCKKLGERDGGLQ